MTLSADILNQRSPYKLSQLGEFTFRFVTDHGSYDPKILDVVTVILEEFFSQEPTVMLYICDSTDHRQAARDRLYHLWFYDYARSHEMTLYSDSVTFRQVNYYAGILMRHDHPLHDMILSYYQDFLKHVPQLYTPREK